MKQPRGKTGVMISNVYPELDGGRYPIKTEIGRDFAVEAEVTAAGPLEVWLQHRRQGEKTWRKVRMEASAPPALPKRYRGVVRFDQTGLYEYTVSVSAGMGSTSKSSPAAEYRTLPLFVEPVVARFGAWYELPGPRARCRAKAAPSRIARTGWWTSTGWGLK